STGIGELVGYLGKFTTQNRKLILVNPSERIQKLLKLAKLDAVFKIYGTEEEAIAAESAPVSLLYDRRPRLSAGALACRPRTGPMDRRGRLSYTHESETGEHLPRPAYRVVSQRLDRRRRFRRAHPRTRRRSEPAHVYPLRGKTVSGHSASRIRRRRGI